MGLATAWWDVGHMLTAAIAEQRMNKLDPDASVRFRNVVGSINDLCNEKSRTFIESACWPDDIKGRDYKMGLWNPWHFKDSPYVGDMTTPVINYTEAAVSSIEVMAMAKAVLSKDVDRMSAEKALSARYAVHLVGDIHQPLHSVALFNKTYPKGDIGGNAYNVTLVNGSHSNFHSFWDAGGYIIQNDTWFITRPMNIQNLTVLRDVANGMISEYGGQVEALAENIDPVTWAQESLEVAVNTTYPHIAKTGVLDMEYTMQTYETARKRITLAGYRLANWAISIFKRAQPQP